MHLIAATGAAKKPIKELLEPKKEEQKEKL